MTITTADFVELLPFSNKIEAAQLNAFITQAHQFDLLPLLGHATLEGIDTLPAQVVLPAPAAGATATAGAYYVRRERVYRALVNTTTPVPVLSATNYSLSVAPAVLTNPAPEGDWQYERVLTLWSQYLRAYWVQRAFSRFVATHGVNVTKAGLTVAVDATTYARPSGGQVATLQASIDNTADTLLSRLGRFLRYEGLLWFIDPQTGGQGYSLDGLTHYGGESAGLSFHGASRGHRAPIRGINARRSFPC